MFTDTPMIGEDIRLFTQALSNGIKFIGERFSVRSRLLKQMWC